MPDKNQEQQQQSSDQETRQGNSGTPAKDEKAGGDDQAPQTGQQGTGRINNVEGRPDEADISEIDRQEGEMNNGELGGNL